MSNVQFPINKSCASLLLAVMAAYGAWLHLVGRQSSPMILLLVSVTFYSVALFVLWPYLREKSLTFRLSSGFCIGYFSAILSAMIVTLILYGSEDFIERAFPSALYDYPLISLGWAFGLIVMIILNGRTAQ